MIKPHPDLIESGKVASAVHLKVGSSLRVGMNLLEIEALIKKLIDQSGLQPAFLGYKKYPAYSCLSVNEQIVHGIPTDYVLKDKDTISIDLGVRKNDWLVDTARTYVVGNATKEQQDFLKVTNQALQLGIEQAVAGNKTGDIGHAVQKYVEAHGYFIIKDLTGHGVGKELQEPPTVPNFGLKNSGATIKQGVVLAIEPITAILPVEIFIEADNWTITASPAVMTAHFEDTIFITSNEPIILT